MENKITLSRFDGVDVEVKPSNIVRVRQTESALQEKGNSRVDGLVIPFYNDQPKAVADMVNAAIKSFVDLRQPGGKPVWFDAAKASGPVPVSEVDQVLVPNHGQIRSALMIGNGIQYVNNTPEEVFAVIDKWGGDAEPPIKKGHEIGAAGKLLSKSLADAPVWDVELYAIPAGGPDM